MKLTAKVIASHSETEFTDGRARVTVKVAEADSMDNKLRLPNAEGLGLDDELVLLVLTKEQAARLHTALTDARALDDGMDDMMALADALRPDEPPPFLATATGYDDPERQFDTAETQEFRLGGTV